MPTRFRRAAVAIVACAALAGGLPRAAFALTATDTAALAGDDFDWDVSRVLAIDTVSSDAQAARGCGRWWYSCDFNEKCPSIGYVVDFLETVRGQNPAAFDRIQYLEQPMPRDLAAKAERVDAGTGADRRLVRSVRAAFGSSGEPPATTSRIPAMITSGSLCLRR